MPSGLRGLVIGGSNRRLIGGAFDATSALPTYCLVGKGSTHAQNANIEYASTLDDVVPLIESKVRRGEIDFVFPASLNDDWIELHSDIHSCLKGTSCQYVGHQPSTLRLFQDKTSTKQLCLDSQVATPEWVLRQEDLERLLVNSPAAVAKTRRGTSGEGQLVLTRSTSEMPNPVNEYFFEELIEGIEFSANLLINRSAIVHYPLMIKGRTGAETPHALDKPRVIADCYPHRFYALVCSVCETLGRNAGASGWLDCDFILTQNELYLIEVNARYSGCVRACSLATGVNPYEVHLRSAFNCLEGRHEIHRNQIVVELPLTQEAHDLERGVSFQKHWRRTRSAGRATIHGASLDEVLFRGSSIGCVTTQDWADRIRSDIQDFQRLAAKYCGLGSK